MGQSIVRDRYGDGYIKLYKYIIDEISRSEMVQEVLRNQDRVNEHYFTKEKLESLDFDTLALVSEASMHMVKK